MMYDMIRYQSLNQKRINTQNKNNDEKSLRVVKINFQRIVQTDKKNRVTSPLSNWVPFYPSERHVVWTRFLFRRQIRRLKKEENILVAKMKSLKPSASQSETTSEWGSQNKNSTKILIGQKRVSLRHQFFFVCLIIRLNFYFDNP